MGRPLKWATLSLICLGLAFAMPAVRVQVFGTPTDLAGWQASLWALGLGTQSLLSMFTQPVGQNWRYVVIGLAAVLNVAFVLVLVAVLRRNRRTNSVRRLTVLVALGLLLAIAAPWTAQNPAVLPLMGYYAWLVAYVLLLSALARIHQPGQT